MVATTYTNPSDMVSSGLQAYDTTTGIIVGRTITAGSNVSVTNGIGTGGNPTISAMTGTPIVSYTPVSSTPYVVNAGDYVLGVDTSVARTIKLPDAPSSGTMYIIKDVDGTANTNNITATSVTGAVLIDSAATYVMNVSYASITVVWNGTKYLIV